MGLVVGGGADVGGTVPVRSGRSGAEPVSVRSGAVPDSGDGAGSESWSGSALWSEADSAVVAGGADAVAVTVVGEGEGEGEGESEGEVVVFVTGVLVADGAGVGDAAVTDPFAGSTSGAVVASVTTSTEAPVVKQDSVSGSDSASISGSGLLSVRLRVSVALVPDAVFVPESASVSVSVSAVAPDPESCSCVCFFGVRSHSPVSGFCTASPSFSARVTASVSRICH